MLDNTIVWKAPYRMIFTSILNARRGGSNGLVANSDSALLPPPSSSDVGFRRIGCKSNLNEIAFSDGFPARSSLSWCSVIRIAVKLLISVGSLAAMLKILFLPVSQYVRNDAYFHWMALRIEIQINIPKSGLYRVSAMASGSCKENPKLNMTSLNAVRRTEWLESEPATIFQSPGCGFGTFKTCKSKSIWKKKTMFDLSSLRPNSLLNFPDSALICQLCNSRSADP